MEINTKIERNERFDIAYRFVTETSENIFLTGKAGTGKTTFLKFLKNHCTKHIVVAAPTGVAAINAAGVTLHSLFQLPFHPFVPTLHSREELLKKMKYNKQRLNLLRKMEVLVIDEISMVRCDVLDAIDTLLKSVRRNFAIPFGGVQLVCIGDLHQLPPVAQPQEWQVLQEYYASPFFFESVAIKEQQPVLIELNKIYRQKEQTFVDLLNAVRTNSMTDDDFRLLHDRHIVGFRPGYNDNYITLTSHNNQANIINQSEISKLANSSFSYKAEVERDFPESMYPAEATLLLKVGAQVMFLKNDPIEKKYFNGKIGVIIALSTDKIKVDCDGLIIEVQPTTWENSKYTLNRTDGKLIQEVVGTFTQYPLRLAWAITIHKSQGLTFDKVMIDAASAFSSGQVYVALSRCTSLAGIVLLNKIPTTAIKDNEQVNKGQQSLTYKGSLAERFEGARQVYTLQLLEQTFAFYEVDDALSQLKYAIDTEVDKLNNAAAEWITMLMQHFTVEKLNGLKFIRQINTLLKEIPTAENNPGLQNRINAAANHFTPKLQGFLDVVIKHPLVTEYREVADKINDCLLAVANELHLAAYTLYYCKSPFAVTTFLQHKLNYAQVKFGINCYASSQRHSKTDAPNPKLYEELKQWRDIICEEEDIPIFMIASHNTLKDVCTYLPTTKRDLLLISGFGKAKVDKYGDEIVKAVAKYCSENNIDTTNLPEKVKAKKQGVDKQSKKSIVKEVKPNSQSSSYELFIAGNTIAQIATLRNFAISTIEGHLAAFVQKGLIPIESIMPIEKYNSIASLLKANEEVRYGELKLQYPELEYGDIKMVTAALKAAELSNPVMPNDV